MIDSFKGAFGVVYRGKWRGTLVAIKTIKGTLSEKQLEDFKSEARLMANLRPHGNFERKFLNHDMKCRQRGSTVGSLHSDSALHCHGISKERKLVQILESRQQHF